MHEKYWAEAGLSCGQLDTRSRAAEDERQWRLYMWHVQYVMTECVAPLAVYRYKQSHSLKPYTRSTTTLYCTRPFPRYVRPD